MEEKTVKINLKTLYQLMISNLRYSYTRNNHLVPSGTYDETKKLFDDMFNVDNEYAIYTLKQICEECISMEIVPNFYDGIDDENGNRRVSIDFVNWCLETIKEKTGETWKPYNYNNFVDNVAIDAKPLYDVEFHKDGVDELLTKDVKVSKNGIFELVFKTLNIATEKVITYNKIRVDDKTKKDAFIIRLNKDLYFTYYRKVENK